MKNEFQQVLSEFSKCRARRKIPDGKNLGREFTKKSRSRIHKKKPVETSQKKTTAREILVVFIQPSV